MSQDAKPDHVEQALVVYADAYKDELTAITDFAEENAIEIHQVSIKQFSEDPARWRKKYSHLVAKVEDTDLAKLVHIAHEHDFSMGMLPAMKSSIAWRLFVLPRKQDELLALAFRSKAKPVDMAVCNDDVVLGMVMLGETPFLNRRGNDYDSPEANWFVRTTQILRLFFMSLWNLFAIHPFPVTVTTGRDIELNTAVTGIVVIENEVRSAAARLVNTTISVQDGKVSMVLIAPKSVIEYLAFLLKAMLQGSHIGKKLPAAISYIKSDNLTIKSPQPLKYSIDGRSREADQLHIKLLDKAVRLNLSADFFKLHDAAREEKDTMKVENLPQSEARIEMIRKHLPLFTHAMEEDFKDLFLLLKNNARVKSDYVILMILSSMVAALGLFLNSAAVIIGAMVLAPLMAPIISLSMAVLRNDNNLLRDSLFCIAVGTGLALAGSALIALLVPFQKMTPEIAARLQPSLLDLGVAIGSGIAGAYAHARESVMKSLPGVAIAVALVPPVCVAGIGIGWFDQQLISGALLLFVTNLVGIVLAGLLTFMVLGYAPVTRAGKGLGLSLMLLIIVSIPLAVSFNNIKRHWQIENQLLTEQFIVSGTLLRLSNIDVSFYGRLLRIRADITSSRSLEPAELEQLKQKLQDMFGQDVLLEVGYRIAV